MPFIVKATYRNETRKFTFAKPCFPTYQDLYHQLYRVFAVGHSYYLSKLLFSPQEGTRILIGMEAHSAQEYDAQVAPFKGHYYPNGRLIFSLYDETPHKVPMSQMSASGPGTSIHPIPPVPPTPFFAPPPPPPPLPPHPHVVSPPRFVPPFPMDIFAESQSTSKSSTMQSECCSVADGKKEVKSLMENFVRDFTRVMATTFGEEVSFLDPLASPSVHHSATPRAVTPMDLEASLPIPGSFIQPRPHSPIADDEDMEKSQSPPHLEPSQMLHPNIWCDFCGKQIRGLRFKCQECAGYDLCANCIVVNQALDKHNANQQRIHGFSTISPPTCEELVSRGPIIPIAPQWRPVPPVSSPPGPVVHENIYCDACQKTVVGPRHKCLDCPDYDLCDTCIKDAPTQHPLHQFLKLDTPGRVIVHTVAAPPEASPPPAPHNARCNLCDSRIVGDRYKCTNCPDFDTCAGCFAITPEQHPTHIFVKIVKPSDIMMPRTFSQAFHPAICDGCNESIAGVRYKCMHAECPDFDLCQNCEALPIPVHPATHPFLKIKTPDTRIPKVQRRAVSSASEEADPSPATALAADATASETTPAVTPAPPPPSVSTPVERLHAIRMQAERRLSARMQQLQSFSFGVSDSTTPNPAVDPIIEERLLRERKEAEQKALAMDQELQAMEKARQKKHEEALKQVAPQPLVDLAPKTSLDTLRGSTSAQDLPSEEKPPTRSLIPEMIQRMPSFFGSPFIHEVESPLKANFISDNNIPDGHIFPAGTEFVKSWRVKNDGAEAWGEGTELVFVGGMRLGAFEVAPTIYEVGTVAPGEEVDVCAGDMKAPDVSGRFSSHWRLRDPQGRQFGPRMWCDVEVLETGSDHSQHDSLVNSEVVMPETAPEQQTPSVPNMLSTPSSPVTVPSTANAFTESDASSVGSVSLVDHNDSDWDDVHYAPSPPLSPPVSPRPSRAPRGGDDVEYLVLYDSSDSQSEA